MLVDPTGKVQVELDEKEGIAYGHVGGCRVAMPSRLSISDVRHLKLGSADVDLINKTRRGVPISVQRRFDCYPDVSAET